MSFKPLIAALAISTVALGQAPPDDAAALLAQARQALGGDAVLSAVSTFTLTGAIVFQGFNATFANSTRTVVISCALPEKFVHVTHQHGYKSATDDTGSDVAEFVGFNGAAAIRDTVAVFGGAAGDFEAAAKSPAERAERRQTEAINAKRMFASFTWPLFAATFSAMPLEIVSASRARMGERLLDVINATDAGGEPWRLFLDATTHLPALVTWRARGLSTYGEHRGTMIGGPTETGGFIDWRLELSDYAVTGGINWPRKLRTSYGTTSPHIDEYKIGRVAINPKIDARMFDPSK